jgi:hypothetical protein
VNGVCKTDALPALIADDAEHCHYLAATEPRSFSVGIVWSV